MKEGYAMSQSFRPVKEIWNTHSSCFIASQELITLLPDLAARVDTAEPRRRISFINTTFARFLSKTKNVMPET